MLFIYFCTNLKKKNVFARFYKRREISQTFAYLLRNRGNILIVLQPLWIFAKFTYFKIIVSHQNLCSNHVANFNYCKFYSLPKMKQALCYFSRIWLMCKKWTGPFEFFAKSANLQNTWFKLESTLTKYQNYANLIILKFKRRINYFNVF